MTHRPSPSPSLSVTFLGAAQAVSGSMHLVEARGLRILLECGLILGRNPEVLQRNRTFPFEPKSLDAVIISHAHVDHCGNLPSLVRQGYEGPVFCTPATRDLMAIMLADSARIQEQDANVDQIAGKPDETSTGLLYTRLEVERTLSLCVTVPYREAREIRPGVELRLLDAGHLLGSALVHLTFDGPPKTQSLLFTGDLGRPDLHFLRPPEALPQADLILCESTYGGRHHRPIEELRTTLRGVVQKTIEREGKVLIPAFSLGRAQLVVHYIRQWMREGQLPAIPILVDSALAAQIAEIYSLHPENLAVSPDPAGRNAPRYIRLAKESHEVSRQPGPCILVASGGMCEAGRILNHFQNNLDDPRNSVVLVSYQAPGSLGRQLLERGPAVKFRGRRWNKWADVVDLSGFSAHAGHNDLMNALMPALEHDPRICLVHGDIENATALSRDLEEERFSRVSIPARLERIGVG